ncbi:MAG: general secretion pathway protein GspD, partial [Thermotogae bacterium]
MRRLFILLILLPVVLLSVDISFYQTDLRDALTQLSEMYGVPIIFSSRITGKVTIELYDVSLDTALNLILTGTSYD